MVRKKVEISKINALVFLNLIRKTKINQVSNTKSHICGIVIIPIGRVTVNKWIISSKLSISSN